MSNRHIEEDNCKTFYKTLTTLLELNQINFPKHFECIHVANEQVRSTGSSGYKAMLQGKRLKAMGKKSGVWDYVVWYFDGERMQTAWLEFKSILDYHTPTKKDPGKITYRKGELKDSQETFGEWLDFVSMKKRVVYTPQEALDFLRELGVIKRGCNFHL